jgi:acyl-coenzyme A synthetase/AMP-(fatty) acid ligase
MHSAWSMPAGCIPLTSPSSTKTVVMRKAGAQVTSTELIEHCRGHLAAYEVPRVIGFVESVPMTTSGKIMRRLLKDIDDGARTHSAAQVRAAVDSRICGGDS